MSVAKLGGVEMYYESTGEGKPLILIMGLGGNVDWWGTAFRKRLAKEHRVIAMDNRGAGRTRDDGLPLSIEQMAADVVALLDALDCNENVDVLGLSMGGMIAQEFALLQASRVDKMVLGCTSAGGADAVMPTPHAMQLLFGMQQVGSAQSAVESQMRLLFPESFVAEHPSLLQSLAKSLFRNPMTRPNFKRQLEAVLKWSGTQNRLPNLSQDALILHGTEDILLPAENGKRLSKHLPHGELILYEGCGHGFAVQEPERVMSDIEAFLMS